jgi:hypothetical protein
MHEQRAPQCQRERRTEAGPAPLAPDLAWYSKDYGLGPEPERYSWEWMEWIETRAIIAGLEAGMERRKKQGR